MDLETFILYLKAKDLSASSIDHYKVSLNKVNEYLRLNAEKFPSTNILDITSPAELEKVKVMLDNDTAYQQLNKIGNRMYSSGLKHYFAFALGDSEFFKTKIDRLDFVKEIPEDIRKDAPPMFDRVVTQRTYRRDSIIVDQVLRSADFECEVDSSHHTFVSAATERAYMEGHHLIPLSAQKYFKSSLDCYADIVCLCPTCHRLLHYGTDNERKYVFDKLFEAREERLCKVGIDGSRNELRQLAFRR